MIDRITKSGIARCAIAASVSLFAILTAALLPLHAFALANDADIYAYGADTGLGGNLAGGGENDNSPAANGGGDEGAAGVTDVTDATTDEAGEVLGAMDRDSTAVVGIVIAILIAIAVIVLILALIPRNSAG